MGRLLLQIILAAYLSMTWEAPSVETEPESLSDPVSRSIFSAYVVAGVDCMEDGSYEEYVESLIDATEAEAQAKADGNEEELPNNVSLRFTGFPKVSLRFMGLDMTDYWSGSETQSQPIPHKAFCSDKFYMEYPYDWYVGSTSASPLTFVSEQEYRASSQVIQDWKEYFDEKLQGDTTEVKAYIEGGGLNEYLEEMIGKPITEEYEFILREEEAGWLLIYDLKKGEKEAAEMVIWCNLGKMNMRNWDVNLTFAPENDYGRILVFQEWDNCDFSTKKAITDYVESGVFLYRLLGTALEMDVKKAITSLDIGSFTSDYHEFVCVDIGLYDQDDPTCLLRQAAAYIPVTDTSHSNWVILFEAFPESRQKKGIFNRQVQKRVMSTFVVLPFYHEVKKGENLSVIAQYYGEDPDLAYEIDNYPSNHISDPDLIYPKQKIEIPLGVLFQKMHHNE